jgi:hypothetical protein
MPKSKAAALRALQFERALAIGHVNLRVVKMDNGWDWAVVLLQVAVGE